MVASCSTFGDKKPAEPQVDPNIYPTKYESYIILFMRDYLKNSADYAGVSISAPALKPFDSVSRYVVCVRLDSQGGQEKIAIFNGGTMSQFIDATPQYCGGVAYRHFTELEAARPK
jgi:hypothetical protein